MNDKTESLTEESKPEENASESTAADEATPGDTTPGDTTPGNTKPKENDAELTSQSDAKPSDSEQKPSSGSHASSESSAPSKAKPQKKGRFLWILLVLLIGLGAIAGGLGYFTYTGWAKSQQALDEQRASMSALETSIAELASENQSMQAAQAADKKSAAQTRASLESRLEAAEKRLLAQNKRLKSMSSISRDDWLLAEAEYLLKLANQRVLVEREPAGAEALLVEADGILRDLVDPDLFPLRKAIAQDLAALRLSKSVDVEGIYLSLLALAEQVSSLPTRPSPDFSSESESESTEQLAAVEGEEKKWWAVPLASFKSFANDFGSQIRVTHHGEDDNPVVLMQPETNLYLQQNLRMQIERGQLALLREQQKIYSESLAQAAHWVSGYFPETEASVVFIDELNKLSGKLIVKNLPDISGSLELLDTYIEDLHDLKGAKPAPKPASEQGGAQ